MLLIHKYPITFIKQIVSNILIQIDFDDIDLSGCSKVDNVSSDPYINTYTINPKSNKKAFILFGEHARELISPETGICFSLKRDKVFIAYL